MSKLYVLNDKTMQGVKGESLQIGLTRSFTATNMVVQFSVSHDNAATLNAAVTPYEFFGACINSLRVDAGAGNDFINLKLTYLMVRMLRDRSNLIYTIDKTSGAGKVSTLLLVVDFTSVGMFSPKDTALNTTRYQHLNTVIKLGEGSLTDFTLNNVSVNLREQQVKNMTPAISNGVAVPPLHRKPIYISKAVVATQSGFTIDLPKNEKFASITLFAMVGDKIVDDVISKIALKIKQNYRWRDTQSQLNNLNRLGLQNFSDTNFNGIMVMDVGQSQWNDAINTATVEENSGQIELDVAKGAHDGLEIIAIFETLIGA